MLLIARSRAKLPRVLLRRVYLYTLGTRVPYLVVLVILGYIPEYSQMMYRTNHTFAKLRPISTTR